MAVRPTFTFLIVLHFLFSWLSTVFGPEGSGVSAFLLALAVLIEVLVTTLLLSTAWAFFMVRKGKKLAPVSHDTAQAA
jgi:hypothetical protein